MTFTHNDFFLPLGSRDHKFLIGQRKILQIELTKT